MQAKNGHTEVVRLLKPIKILEYKHYKNGSCIICLENIDKSKNIIKLQCGHDFHKECLLEWLNKNDNCPICKKKCVE